MEVLSMPPSVSVAAPPSSYTTHTPQKPSRPSSLLDRRTSAQKLMHREQDTASATVIPLSTTTNLLTASPSLLVSHASASGLTANTSSNSTTTSFRSSRSTTATILPFVPLTPIMASPRLTPEIGAGPGSVVIDVGENENNGGNSAGRGKNVGGGGSGNDNNARTHNQQIISDYLNRGRPSQHQYQQYRTIHVPSTLPSISTTVPPTLPTPSWTSTPPTPPLKGMSPPLPSRLNMALDMSSDAQDQTNSSSSREALCNRSRSRSSSRSQSSVTRRRLVRPASVSAIPAYRSPSPPALSLYTQQADSTIQPTAHYTSASHAYTRSLPRLTADGSASPVSLNDSSPASSSSDSILLQPRSYSLSDILSIQTSSSPQESPNLSPTIPASSGGAVKRRRTLPRHLPSFSQVHTDHYQRTYAQSDEAVCMCKRPRSLSSGMTAGMQADSDGLLLPSLNRGARGCARGSHSASPLRSSPLVRADSPGSSRGRKMFIVGGDGEPSDYEAEVEVEEKEESRDTSGASGEEESATASAEGTKATTPDDSDSDVRCEGCEKAKEDRERTRRFHVLLELLTTEVGYLVDLRALVSIYLAQLTSLDVAIPSQTLTRPSPSTLSMSSLGLSRPFPSSRSSFLHAQSGPTQSGAGPGPPDTLNVPSSTERHRDAFDRERERELEKAKEKPLRRPLLSSQEVETITRNAAELLAVHERFVTSLKESLIPLGFNFAFSQLLEGRRRVSREGRDDLAVHNVDEAIRVVSDAFVRQAPAFEVYEAFCPGHNEATDLIRSIQDQHPVEWDAYEQRCSLRVSHAFDRAGSPTPSVDSMRGRDSIRSKRRHSMSSLAVPVPLLPCGGMGMGIAPSPLTSMSHQKSDPTGRGHKRKGSGDITTRTTSQVGRLKLHDYLIKPVQRICKYHLLLDQLKHKRPQAPLGGDCSSDYVEAARLAMRDVVELVNHASERQAHLARSTLIASRLISNCPASPTSPVSPEDRPAQLSAEFVQSLGPCSLAGALDVVYYQSSGSARAKYLAAFLYAGGYLVLAKVPKGGKVYEPKHWFNLAGYEIVDQEEDDPALPYAFHLCNDTTQIHLAAACQSEKTAWITAIQDALIINASPWTNEPMPHIPSDARPLVYTPEEANTEWASHLPTIQSMSEMETPGDSTTAAPPLSSPRRAARTMSRVDSIILRPDLHMGGLNRRTSTSSVKAFFAPLSFDSRVTRPSSQIRQQVDNGLHDVVTEAFMNVRSQAQMRDEELFQLRKKPANVSRSNSGLSISGAFSGRRRNDSIVMSSRRKPSMDGAVVDITSEPEGAAKSAGLILARRTKSVGGKYRSKRLSLAPHPSLPMGRLDLDGDAQLTQSPEGSVESPSPMTQCSSATSSNANSVLPSPLEMTIPLPMPHHSLSHSSPDTRRGDFRPKRTRSMVDNVKYFFHSRSTSPTPLSRRSPHAASTPLDVEGDTHGGLMQWWRRGSLRRRAQSSPDTPTDESSPVTPAASSDDSSHCDLKVTEGQMLTPEPRPDLRSNHSLPVNTRRVAFSDAPPLRRRSLFVTSSRFVDTRAPEMVPSLSRSRTLKNIFHLQRVPSPISVDSDTLP